MPQAGRSHVLVRVTAAGVCGTDLTDYRQRLAAPGTLPAVPLGHEVAGTVADAGESGWAVGTPVVVDPAFFCGACHHCEAGRTSYCTELKLLGHNYGSGGLTDHLAVPADALVEIPPGIDPVAAALIEPLSCAHHAARKAGDESSEAVIVGAGAIGVGIALVLRAQGFERLVLLDPVAERRAAATALGLDARAEPPRRPRRSCSRHPASRAASRTRAGWCHAAVTSWWRLSTRTRSRWIPGSRSARNFG